MSITRPFILACIGVCIIGITGAVSFAAPLSPTAAPAEMARVFITFHDTPGASERALVRSFGVDVRYEYGSVPTVAARIPESAIEQLERHPLIAHITPDGMVEVQATETELGNAWGVERIGAGTVHGSAEVTGAGVKVGIIDSGINYWHPELAGTYQGGYDFYYFNDDPMDVYGHGTHVAGTACATYNDAAEVTDTGEPLYGVVGAAPACDLYALRVLNEDGVGYWSDIAAAVEWSTGATVSLEPWADVPGQEVTGKRMDVINLSLGKSAHPGEAVEEIFANAYDAGVVIVAAAGNSGNRGGNNDSVIYPAKFDSVIAVAATDSSDTRATFSSTGDTIELSAPGVAVYSTWNNDVAYSGTPNCRGALETHELTGEHEAQHSSVTQVAYGDCYKFGSGTSMAAPHVAGAAALVMAADPTVSAAQVRHILAATADPLGAAHRYGHGLVNAWRAVHAVGADEPVVSPAVQVSVSTDQAEYGHEGSDVEVTVAVTDEHDEPVSGLPAEAFSALLNDAAIGLAVAESGTAGVYIGHIDANSLAVGEYTLVVTVSDGDQEATAATEFTVVLASDSGDAPSGDVESVSIGAVDHRMWGGRNQDRHIETAISVIDTTGAGVADVSVVTKLHQNGDLYEVGGGVTDGAGVLEQGYSNAPDGEYELVITIDTLPTGYVYDGEDISYRFEK